MEAFQSVERFFTGIDYDYINHNVFSPDNCTRYLGFILAFHYWMLYGFYSGNMYPVFISFGGYDMSGRQLFLSNTSLTEYLGEEDTYITIVLGGDKSLLIMAFVSVIVHILIFINFLRR